MKRLSQRLTGLAFSLRSERHWRAFLVAVFLLAVAVRFLVYLDLGTKPIGDVQEWPGSDPWFYYQSGQGIAVDGDWVAREPGIPKISVTTNMLGQLTPRDWERFARNRLPRGAPAIHLIAVSYSLTGSLVIYRLLALIAGGLLCVGIATTTAHIFADRRPGALAGIVAASHQSLVLLSIIPGPWLWEALAFVAVVYTLCRLRGEPANPAAWAILGVAAGMAVWTRPIFFWIVPALPLLLWHDRIKPSWQVVAAFVVPFALLVGSLTARNIAADSTKLPMVGQPAWDFARTVHPQAVFRAEFPADYTVMQASRGRLRDLILLTWEQASYRQVLPRVFSRKLREFYGARDEPWTFNMQYMRRRSELLRVTTLAPDTTMAAGWGAFLLLFLLRRLPRGFAAILGILSVHALLFGTAGEDRLMLHCVFCMLIAAALGTVWYERRHRPWGLYLFIALWAGAHLLLQVDDQSRGTRFRSYEFQTSARIYRYTGRPGLEERELTDLRQIRRNEQLLRMYWYYRN